jgi:AsmA protein
MSSFGSFVLRDETVGFAFDCGAAAAAEDGLRVPVNLTFTSKPLAAKVTGTASFNNGLQLDGDVQADMENARSFLRWTGIAIPLGRSLQKLSVAGTARWNGSTLTFDDGTFSLDGNKAVGLLAITPGPRPRIDATLDFERLAIDPYLAGDEPPLRQAQAGMLEGALIKYFDADLRISAEEVTAPMIKLGPGGFTISTKDSVLTSEVGELQLCGGEASGSLGIDLSREVAKASVVASLDGIPVEGCLDASFLVPLKGTTTLKAEMSGEGRTYWELIQALSGALKVNADNGAIPLDLARLLAAAPTPLDGEGWSRNSVTLFDSLSADCRLGGGHIWCDMFNMQTRRGLIAGSGNVDMAQATLDWNLFVASDAQPVRASQLSVGTPPRISISGALAQPMIRRTDRPTLGDGSLPTGSTANQISPR